MSYAHGQAATRGKGDTGKGEGIISDQKLMKRCLPLFRPKVINSDALSLKSGDNSLSPAEMESSRNLSTNEVEGPIAQPGALTIGDAGIAGVYLNIAWTPGNFWNEFLYGKKSDSKY